MADIAREDWVFALRNLRDGTLEGRAYWRGIHELLADPVFEEVARQEFPSNFETLSRLNDLAALGNAGEKFSRREFLMLMGASLALAGLGGCLEAPRERIYPYTERPTDVTPGVPRRYATAMSLDGYATGLIVESHEGRPTKVEGNPLHPASLGAAGVYEQASILQLYDPHRARAPRHLGAPVSWQRFQREMAWVQQTPGAEADGGAGFRILSTPTASPLTSRLIEQFLEDYPRAAITSYAPLASTASLDGTRILFGRPLQPIYDLSNADVIVALDSDLLSGSPFHLAYARAWAARRQRISADGSMNRFYAVESTVTPTGMAADRRLRVRPSEIPEIAAALLSGSLRQAGTGTEVPTELLSILSSGRWNALPEDREDQISHWLVDLIRDLAASRGRSAIIAGDRQPPEIHAIAAALNLQLGNVGRSVRYVESALPDFGSAARDISELAAEMQTGEVSALLILGGNPIYDAPADLEFAAGLEKVETAIYHGLFENETAANCDWFLPDLHFLESWGDVRALDGTASIVQPLIRPLYDGRSADDLLMMLNGAADRSVHAELQNLWMARSGPAEFDEFWQATLRQGVIAGTEAQAVEVRPDWQALSAQLAEADRMPPGSTPGQGGRSLEVIFTRDASVYDGRFANNPWLQELPDPLTKLTWDNAAIVSPRTAAELNLTTGTLVRIRLAGSEIVIPIAVLPGHADDSVTLPLGYGRKGTELVASGVGTDVYSLRTSSEPYMATGATLEPGAASYPLATTQEHWSMEGRPIVLSTTLAEYREDPGFAEPYREAPPSLFPPFDYQTGDQWTMVIDLAACTGCSACVIACQAENNIPVVGKEGVRGSREMHWLRIDRYFTGPPEDPHVVFQPMLCQHCEHAPCEYVCPVNATVHSPDGLNEMIYNRCIGTRFCSNNCPYKVRRFNWLDYQARKPEPLEMQMNPDVTVRARGVMEKCTFCVQRIRRAQIQARLKERDLEPMEVQTACQQTCPTQAIWFGSSTNSDDLLQRRLADPRRYAVLNELGTRPRVSYLARVENPSDRADG